MGKFSNRIGRTSWLVKLLKKLLLAVSALALFLVATQDFQIFPGALFAIMGVKNTAPKDVEEYRAVTKDGEKILVWRLAPPTRVRKEVVLLFHGNAESLTTFVKIQRWFAAHGFTSYAFEYRGYSGSSGFPSENGLYRDGEAAMDLLLTHESLSPDDVVIFGNSVGTGPAAHVAQVYNVNSLVLIAPYVDLKSVVQEMPFMGYFAPFLWYRFPTSDYIKKLRDTCVISAHGKMDTTIPYNHSEKLQSLYVGNSSFKVVLSDNAGHYDIFGKTHKQVINELDRCLSLNISRRAYAHG
jgi:alpha-beta hydrolase superfamily lysophospholipase